MFPPPHLLLSMVSDDDRDPNNLSFQPDRITRQQKRTMAGQGNIYAFFAVHRPLNQGLISLAERGTQRLGNCPA